jgi:DNA-3-methyladenine glycosylase
MGRANALNPGEQYPPKLSRCSQTRWPGLTRPPTSLLARMTRKDVDPRVEPAGGESSEDRSNLIGSRRSRPQGGQPPLSRAELPVDTVLLARYLIGKLLVREMTEGVASGRIVETEAYVIGDAAGHAYHRMTPRNRSLFLERGHAYVYFVYGSAYMLNVSSETAGIGAGVLIRALEPCDGVSIMRQNRNITRLRDLARGPGRLTAALRVDRRFDGLDLCREGDLWLGCGDDNPGAIGQSSRIGITRDVDRPLRFYLRGSPFVSGPRSLTE